MESKEIKIGKTEWDFSSMFSGDNDPLMIEKRKLWREKTDKFISKWKDNKEYLEKPEIMREALDDYAAWASEYGTEGDEYFYFHLREAQDQNSTELKAKFNKIEEFVTNIQNDIQFFELSIGTISKKNQTEFLDFPELKAYRHFLNRIFIRSKHFLSEKEEKIMNLKSASAQDAWVKMVEGFLSKEEREVLNESGNKEMKSFSEIISLTASKKKDVRNKAAEAFNDVVLKHRDSAVAEINAVLADKKVNDELRGYNRPDKSRHIGDDIDSDVVDSLIDSVTSKFEISRKFYELKAKLLGLDKLKYHERNVEYGEIDKKYTYEDSAKLVSKVFYDLDSKFGDIFKMFLEKGLIDVYPRKGKSGGAFCFSMLKSQPTYVLLNHTDRLRDVDTIAHEMGHAVNSELMRENQNILNFGTGMSTAEVASTFMEDFVLEELTKEADEELKLILMVKKLDDDIKTILRQVACYNFEKELHNEFREKGHLSHEEIGKLFQKNMSAYMGNFVEQSEGSENWWIYWSHIRYFFYVYSYASGLLISKVMQSKVRENKEFISKVKEFLSAGRSKSPKDIFLDLGIDITKKEFWDSGLSEMEDLLKEIEDLAKKLGKI